MELVANSTPVRLFLDYLDHLGISPRALQVGHIDPRLRKSRAPVWVSARLLVELLEATTLDTGRDDIGLDFVAWVNPRGFGELSLVWEQCSSLAERLAIEQRYIHLENNAEYFEIAALLAMSPPTLQRQLAARGTDYRAVLEAVRVEIASAVLDAPRPPRLAKLAYNLGFSASSAAWRFLHKKVRASSARQRGDLL